MGRDQAVRLFTFMTFAMLFAKTSETVSLARWRVHNLDRSSYQAHPSAALRFSAQGTLFTSQCKRCFSKNTSWRCDRLFEECYQISLTAHKGPMISEAAENALTAQCALAEIPKTPTSILCSGVKAILECNTTRRCAMLTAKTIIVTGVSVALMQELQKVSNKTVKTETDNERRTMLSVAYRKHIQKVRPFLKVSFNRFFEPRLASMASLGSLKISEKRKRPFKEDQKNTGKISQSLGSYEPDPTKQSRNYQSLKMLEILSEKSSTLLQSPIQTDEGNGDPSGTIGPDRRPIPVTIRVTGSRLTREKIISEAIRKLKNRDEFRDLFQNDIKVIKVVENHKTNVHVVDFRLHLLGGSLF